MSARCRADLFTKIWPNGGADDWDDVLANFGLNFVADFRTNYWANIFTDCCVSIRLNFWTDSFADARRILGTGNFGPANFRTNGNGGEWIAAKNI